MNRIRRSICQADMSESEATPRGPMLYMLTRTKHRSKPNPLFTEPLVRPHPPPPPQTGSPPPRHRRRHGGPAAGEISFVSSSAVEADKVLA